MTAVTGLVYPGFNRRNITNVQAITQEYGAVSAEQVRLEAMVDNYRRKIFDVPASAPRFW